MSNIDDIFKKGLDGKGMEYSDASWAGMEQMLNTKEVGFFARYKLLFGLSSLLLIGSVALLYFNTKETTVNTPAVVTDSAAENAAEVEINEDLAANSIGSSQNIEISETEEEHNESLVLESKVDEVSITQDVTAPSTNISYVESKASAAGMVDTYKDPKDNGFRTDEPIALASGGNENVNLSTNAQFLSAATDENVRDFSSVALPATAESEVLVKPKFGSIISAKGISIAEIAYSDNVSYPSELDFLPNLKKKKYSFYLSPYAGYLMYAKSVVAPDFITDENNNLGKSETQNLYNYGLNFGIKKDNWTLSSGIGFLSLKENIFYTASSKEYEYITAPRISNSEYTTTPRGTRVALVSMQNVDSTLVESADQVCEGCEVSFNYVSVPLSLQYNFGKYKLRYFAEAGVTASFLQNAKGVYATLKDADSDFAVLPSTQLVDLSTSEDVSKMLIQANAAVGVKFWLTPRWNLWSSYGYGMGLNSMLGSYEQKPTIQNVRVGVEFKLR